MRRLIATLCSKDCCCPELFIDDEAEPPKQVVIRDDFGNEIQMSKEQLEDFKKKVVAKEI